MKLILENKEEISNVDPNLLHFNNKNLYYQNRLIYSGENAEKLFEKICRMKIAGFPILNLGSC